MSDLVAVVLSILFILALLLVPAVRPGWFAKPTVVDRVADQMHAFSTATATASSSMNRLNDTMRSVLWAEVLEEAHRLEAMMVERNEPFVYMMNSGTARALVPDGESFDSVRVLDRFVEISDLIPDGVLLRVRPESPFERLVGDGEIPNG